MSTDRTTCGRATRGGWALATLLVLFCSSGAHCVPKGPQAPRLLPDSPNLAQIMEAVNNNTSRVHMYETQNARISIPGVPTVPANLAIERPHRLRLRAATTLTGPELDLGSNEDVFWFWARRSHPPSLYYCRHAEFANSAARQMLPLEPGWLIEALGLTGFDLQGQHSGPTLTHGNRLEIRSQLPRPEGEVVKVTVVDPIYAWVLEQHVYTPGGQRIASVLASDHRYDPAHQVSLPRHIELQMPATQLNLRIDTGDIRINALSGNPQELWSMPNYSGYPALNLADPNLAYPSPNGPPPQGTPAPLTAAPPLSPTPVADNRWEHAAPLRR